MKKVCAWCNKELSSHESEASTPITHGICTECRQLLEMDEIEIKTVIDNYDLPVVFLKHPNKILLSNQKAINLLEKFDLLEEEHTIGSLVRCRNIDLSQQCNTNPLCSSCKVIEIINRTLNTGIGVKNEKILLLSKKKEIFYDKQEIEISSEKIGAGVLLKIMNR